MVRFFILLILASTIVGCGDAGQTNDDAPSALEMLERDSKRNDFTKLLKPPKMELEILENGEPNYVVVKHLLIGFKGALYGRKKSIERTKEGAHQLVMELYGRIQSGEDMDSIIKEYSEDSLLHEYQLANDGLEGYRNKHVPTLNILKRADVEPSFGKVAFNLEVNAVGIAEYHPVDCKRGWHIIKRIK